MSKVEKREAKVQANSKTTNNEPQTTNLPKRLGIMGGTFDPIHYGHLVTAEQALSEFDLDKVIFMPTYNPPHKQEPKVTADERYIMAVIATADNDNYEVSKIEIDRKGKSYTVDTLNELGKIYPEAKFYFITGADAILEILTWKDAEKVALNTRIIAATRPGYSFDKLNEFISNLSFKASISILEVPALAISSTDVREKAKKGKPIRYLLPDDISEYIYKKGLYR